MNLISKKIQKYHKKHNGGVRRCALKGAWGFEVLRNDTSEAEQLCAHLDMASMNKHVLLSPEGEVIRRDASRM